MRLRLYYQSKYIANMISFIYLNFAALQVIQTLYIISSDKASYLQRFNLRYSLQYRAIILLDLEVATKDKDIRRIGRQQFS
jgi:hypothetical protein